MKPFQGFGGFDPLNTSSQGAAPEEVQQQSSSTAGNVFQQMMQHMQQHKTAQKSHSRNLADNLWLMGQGHTK
jgi:hypothetical protein